MIPTFIFQIWLLGLLSLGVVGGASYAAYRWQEGSWVWDPSLMRSVFSPDFSSSTGIAQLITALGLTLIAVAGGPIVKCVLRLSCRKPNEDERDPRAVPVPTSERFLERPDGSRLLVTFYGPEGAETFVLTHGWGMSGGEWNNVVAELSGRFRVVTWDEPGLGRSTRPDNRDFSLENLASHLAAVLSLTGGKKVTLVGHSIGGMIILTFCRLFPEMLERHVHGIVLTHTTPQNPLRTTVGAGLLTAIERPVLFPLMYLTIAFSPVLWLVNWLSYFNGSAHLMTKRSSFAGTETWLHVDFAARFQPKASPAVIARGMLAMMRYEARDVLPMVPVRTLIVSGNRDTTTKPEASADMQIGIPLSKLVELSPAKHLGLIEHGRQYTGLLQEFAAARATSGPLPGI